MTATRIADIRKRLVEATPGPWHMKTKRPGASTALIFVDPEIGTYCVASTTDKDAALIAAAPSDLAWLLDRLQRAEELLRLTMQLGELEFQTGRHETLWADLAAFLGGDE